MRGHKRTDPPDPKTHGDGINAVPGRRLNVIVVIRKLWTLSRLHEGKHHEGDEGANHLGDAGKDVEDS